MQTGNAFPLRESGLMRMEGNRRSVEMLAADLEAGGTGLGQRLDQRVRLLLVDKQLDSWLKALKELVPKMWSSASAVLMLGSLSNTLSICAHVAIGLAWREDFSNSGAIVHRSQTELCQRCFLKMI